MYDFMVRMLPIKEPSYESSYKEKTELDFIMFKQRLTKITFRGSRVLKRLIRILEAKNAQKLRSSNS